MAIGFVKPFLGFCIRKPLVLLLVVSGLFLVYYKPPKSVEEIPVVQAVLDVRLPSSARPVQSTWISHGHSPKLAVSTRAVQPSSPGPKCGYIVRSFKPAARLGNQMLMYASFYGTLLNLNFTKEAFIRLRREDWTEILSYWNLSIPLKKYPDQWFRQRHFETLREKSGCCAYSDDLERLGCDGRNVIIDGFRFSHKYFEGHFDEIKKLFEFGTTVKETCKKNFSELLESKKLSSDSCFNVAVHLRRGDMLDKANREVGHWPAQEDYVRKALSFFDDGLLQTQNISTPGKNASLDCIAFVVFGDAHAWNLETVGKVQLDSKDRIHFLFVDAASSDPVLDLCLMNLCDHVIMSTGTFGWWAGFMNNGTVVYQKQHSRPGSGLERMVKDSDYFLPSWMPL